MVVLILIVQSRNMVFSLYSLSPSLLVFPYTLMMKFDLQLNSCGFDPDNLDDWLESDLKQSGILPSDKDDLYNDIKFEHPSDWERHSCSDGSDDKTVVDEFELDNNNKSDTLPTYTPLPTQLAPILKALAVLTSLQHQQGTTTLPGLPPLSSPTPPLTPDAINPIHMTKTPVPMNLQAHSMSTSSHNITSHSSTKRQRGVETASAKVDSLDPLALKRQKNTDAARRSRQRKVMKMERLESRVMELEQQNEQLLLQVAVAENQRDVAKVNESKQREKVAALEAQLAKSHQALLQQKQTKVEEKEGESSTTD